MGPTTMQEGCDNRAPVAPQGLTTVSPSAKQKGELMPSMPRLAPELYKSPNMEIKMLPTRTATRLA